MRVSTAATVALVVLLLASTGAVAAAPSMTASAAPDRSPSAASSTDYTVQYADEPPLVADTLGSQSAVTDQQPLPAADPAQVIRISVDESGDTQWTIETRFLLSDDDVEAFTQYAEEVTAGDRDVELDQSLFEREATAASASTGREMAIEGYGWDEPRIEAAEDDSDAEIGIISQSFTWTNFATQDDDRVYFGDAFQTPDGPWLSTLNEQQRLVIESPSGYSFDQFNTPPTTSSSGAFVWDGPMEFDDDGLDIVFLRVISVQNWGLLAVGGTILLVLTAATAYLAARRRPTDDSLPRVISRILGTGGENTESGAASDTETTASDRAPTGTDGGNTALSFDEDEDVDLELLSDEERVHRLLSKNGGRMKQASIVTETGWSNAKVSQLLSKMDDEGEIEKLRIGRENLITHPDVDPTEVD